jgi:hypothetical protein
MYVTAALLASAAAGCVLREKRLAQGHGPLRREGGVRMEKRCLHACVWQKMLVVRAPASAASLTVQLIAESVACCTTVGKLDTRKSGADTARLLLEFG